MTQNVSANTPQTSPPAMCELVDEKRQLRQGDIFARTSDEECHPVGIIVTSDCDIVRPDKAWRILTWIPIVPAASYLASRWAYDEIIRLSSALKTDLTNAVAEARRKQSAPLLSPEAVESWLRRLTQTSLCDPFLSSDDQAEKRLHAKFDRHVEALLVSRDLLERVPARHECWPSEMIQKMFEAVRLLKSAKSPNFKLEKLMDDVQNALAGHPEDVFPLFSIQESDYDGHVALLRFLREVDQGAIGLQAGDAVEHKLEYYRIASLVSPYRYDLTRRLGAVFSDIGLPQPYADHKRAAATRIAERLMRIK